MPNNPDSNNGVTLKRSSNADQKALADKKPWIDSLNDFAITVIAGISGFRGLAAIVLFLLSLAVFWPGQTTIPVLDRDEARFAQATKQMVATGDYIDIRFQENPRYQKPIGIYWLQGLAVLLSGRGEGAPVWIYRSVSLVGAALSVMLTYLIGSIFFSSRSAFTGALLLLAMPAIGVEGHLAKTDGALLALILTMQLGLALVAFATNENKNNLAQRLAPWMFWVGLGLGVLIKGPIAPLVGGCTLLGMLLLVKDRSWLKRLNFGLGGILLAILVIPWFVLIGLKSGGDFFYQAFAVDFSAKIFSAQQSHGMPPGSYLFLFWLLAWPLAPFLLISIDAILRRRLANGVIFCLSWIVPVWVVFELATTKLPHYILPLYPALALLAGAALSEWGFNIASYWRKVVFSLVAIVPIIIVASLPALLLFSEGRVLWGASGAGALAGLLGFAAWWLMNSRASCLALIMAVLSGAVFQMTVFSLVLPQMDSIWVAARVAETLDDKVKCAPQMVASVGYNEPSLIFTLGTDTKLTNAEGAARFLVENDCAVVLITMENEPAFFTALKGIGVKELARISGRNIARLKSRHRLNIGLYRLADDD